MLKRISTLILLVLTVCLSTMAQTLTCYEYWLDSDFGKRTVKNNTAEEINFSVPLGELENGPHFLNFRAMNSDGDKGLWNRYIFFIPEKETPSATITQYEYWIDENYSGRVHKSGNDTNPQMSLDISQLEEGVHFFNYRAQNSDGRWGTLLRYIFFIPEYESAAPTISQYEYWIDGNYASRVHKSGNDTNPQMSLDISQLEEGVHFFNYRAQNSDGRWGTLLRYIFFIPEYESAAPTISQYEYWIDGDYGNRVRKSGNDNNLQLSFDISQLEQGAHYFNYRAQNSDGRWGTPLRYIFVIPDYSEIGTSPIAGYRYSFNGKAMTEVSIPETMEYTMENVIIPIPELSEFASLTEGCTYSFNDSEQSVTLNRNTEVHFTLKFFNANGRESAPVDEKFSLSGTSTKHYQQLNLRGSVTLSKMADGDFEAFRMELSEARTYYLKASANCKVRLLNANGSTIADITGEQLRQTYGTYLQKGTYYGIVYGASQDVTIRLMLTENIVDAPVISYEQEMVTITCAEPTATIYYTLDGTDPTKASTRYNGPFALRHNAVVKAIAMAQDMADSDIATLTVNSYKVATPTIEFTNLKLYMNCQTEGASIFYTLDGSDPTMNGQRYTEPVSISNNCTAKAVGKRDGYNNSEIAVFVVDVSSVKTSTPQIKREGDGLRITCLTEGATLHYTVDGTTPTASSPVVNNGFLQPQLNGVVKVIAMKDGELPSDVASINVDWLQVAKPVLSYDVESSVLTMTCTTPGATIYYELGGNEPTQASPHGSSGLTLTLTDNRVVKAMAMADRLNPSEVAVYTPGSFTVEAVQVTFNGRYLTMSCATEGATIHYALSDGLTGSGIYSSPITIEQLGTGFAWAEKADMNSSERTAFTIESCFDGTTAHSTAGKLSNAFTWCGTDDVQALTVDGSIDETDLAFLRSMPALRHLNLSAVSLTANHLPAGAFAGMPLLSIAVPTRLSSAGDGLFRDCQQLAAITWNLSFRLTEQMLSGFENPNLLLYVKMTTDAPNSVKNVVANGVAASITLTDADGNNNFYCPTTFTAKHISYQHNYTMATVTGVCRGWETICLPFQVSRITHESKGELAPFAAHNESAKPFWLCKLTRSGFESADKIEAFTPYIISMPNNPEYADSYIIGGNVTFEGENVTITEASLESYAGKYANKTMLGTFRSVPKETSMMVLNVGEEYDGYVEGSAFFRDLDRETRPFHAYVVEDASSRIFAIGEATTSGIEDITVFKLSDGMYYDLQGRPVGKGQNSLNRGVYIKDGKKVLVK